MFANILGTPALDKLAEDLDQRFAELIDAEQGQLTFLEGSMGQFNE